MIEIKDHAGKILQIWNGKQCIQYISFFSRNQKNNEQYILIIVFPELSIFEKNIDISILEKNIDISIFDKKYRNIDISIYRYLTKNIDISIFRYIDISILSIYRYYRYIDNIDILLCKNIDIKFPISRTTIYNYTFPTLQSVIYL